MNETIEAIRQKFAPAPAVLPTREERAIAGEAYELGKLAEKIARRGMRGPTPRPRPAGSTEEIRVTETAAAYAAACGAEGKARREYLRLQADNGLMAKVLTPNALDRARRALEAAERAKEFARMEADEALLARGQYHQRQRAQQRTTAAAEIATLDRERTAQRRAAGLPPLPKVEHIPLSVSIFEHFGGSVR